MRYVYAILALGLLIAFHELGHLVLARVFRIRVKRYSIGFGPPIVSFKARNIEWVLGAIPLGGYVQVHGMNPHEEGDLRSDPSSFLARPWWQRELVLVAGSAFNYLLALTVLVALFVSGTHVPVPRTVGTVVPGSEAARAQLRPGDELVAVDGQPIEEWRELVERVQDSAGRTLVLQVRRADGTVEIPVTPRADEDGAGRIGISQQYVYRSHGFGEAVQQSFAYTTRLIREAGHLLWRLVRGKPGVDLASPVIIVKQASDAASLGWDAFLRVLVHISIALALFNLLPFPALDGGRMLFTAIEAIRGRPVNPRLETALHALGFLLLFALILFVAASDVMKLVRSDTAAAPPGAPASDAGTGAGE